MSLRRENMGNYAPDELSVLLEKPMGNRDDEDVYRTINYLKVSPETVVGELLFLFLKNSPYFLTEEELNNELGGTGNYARSKIQHVKHLLRRSGATIYACRGYNMWGLIERLDDGDVHLPANIKNEIDLRGRGLDATIVNEWKKCGLAEVRRQILQPRFSFLQFGLLSSLFENFGVVLPHSDLAEVLGYERESFENNLYGVRSAYNVAMHNVRNSINGYKDIHVKLVKVHRYGYGLNWVQA